MISSLVMSAAVATAAPGTFGVGISPAVVTGPASSTATFTVRDAGTTPLALRVAAVEERPVKGGGWTPWHAYGQATVSPGGFTLQPGQARQVKITVRATDGYRHRLAVTAQARPQGAGKGASVTPAVAAAYTIPGSPNPAYAEPVSVPRPVAPGPGFPWWPVALGGLILAVLGVLANFGRRFKLTRR